MQQSKNMLTKLKKQTQQQSPTRKLPNDRYLKIKTFIMTKTTTTNNNKNNKKNTIKHAIKSYQQGPPPSKGNGEWVPQPTFEQTKSLFARSFAGTETVSGNPECD